MRSFLALLAIAASPAFGSQILAPITGTCGFYQGTRSNVVYSQNFTGDGTFCTGFQSGGSFTNNGSLVFGDISITATNNLLGVAPAGYGVFVHIDELVTVTQQYLITGGGFSSGFVGTFLESHGVDDGSGLGGCSLGGSMNFGGFSNTVGSPQFFVPDDFINPISVVQTVHLTCDESDRVGGAFGDGGNLNIATGPIMVFNADKSQSASASITSVPEPSTFGLIALGLGFVLRRRLFGKCLA